MLALLLSGLLQPLSAAHGLRCARSEVAASGTQVDDSRDQVGATHVAVLLDAAIGEHQHAPDPGADATLPPGAPCSPAAVPAERSALLHTFVPRTLLSPGDLPPASLLTRSLFRPPRLS